MNALLGISVSLTVFMVVFGPGSLMVRSLLRPFMSRQRSKSCAGSVRVGLGAGVVLAVLLIGYLFGDAAAMMVALVCLSAFLAIMDWSWHWLPWEWTLALWASGLAVSGLDQHLVRTAMESGFVFLTLLLMQVGYRKFRGADGLGTGDIVLMAGICAHLGFMESWIILGAAALAALIVEAPLAVMHRQEAVRTFGVAFGTYLCAFFALWLVLREIT